MAKHKYRINKTSLEYEKVQLSWSDRFKRVGFYFIGGIAFSALVMTLSYSFFDSPKELMLKRENEQYKLKYEKLNSRVNNLSTVLIDLEERDNNIYRTIFEAEPISEDQRRAGFGGSDRYREYQGYKNSEQIIESAKDIDQLSRRLYVQSKSFDKIFELAKTKATMMASIPAIQPISNKDLSRIASGYGYRMHPIYKTWKMHSGIDFTAPKGTPIYATGDGKIWKPKKNRLSGYGKTVIINHGYGYKSLYAHMSKIIVKPGQKVKRGQIIGYVGSTGISTGPHLHYEVWKSEARVNPVHFFYQDLSPAEYEKVIEIASRPNQSMS